MAAVANVDLQSALNRFGLNEFRRGQREVIDHILSGNDCLCVMPTGGGKSLCYQLPSVLRNGLTIVVSPLIALMKDQVDGLVKRGISATLINSSLSPSEQNYRLERVAGGHYSLLYVAPERLRNSNFLETIRSTPVQLLAIDEAHCISEWGHDFRPDYQRVGRFREALGGVQTIALTATATPKVRQDIVDSLKLRVAKHFITGFARDNLYFGVLQTHSDREKDKKLVEFLETKPGSGIVYAATRKRCESLVELISKEVKIRVGAYHAGLMPDQRKFIQEQFMRGELDCIVATNAFGMGIDKSDLRFVVHYNMPGTLEAYYQEAGRAGRDGLSSQCVLFFSTQDRYIQEFFIENANPPREQIQAVYEFLANRTEDPIELTAEEIREQSNIPATAEAINSSLQILGRTDVLERLEVAGGLAMVRIDSKLPTLVDLLPREATVKRTVLRAVEKAIGDRREEAVYIHPRWLMSQLEMEREVLSRHLRELCSVPGFEYLPPFRGRAIHFRKREVPFDQLKIDHANLALRKKADYEKLDQMVAFAQSKICRQKTILLYFGDSSANDCGICDRCQGKAGWPRLPVSVATPPAKLTKKKEKKGKASPESSTTSNAQGESLSESPPRIALEDRSSGSSTIEEPLSSAPPSKSKAKSKQGPVPSLSELEQAARLVERVLGAIERTHGYLSKTVLSQYFAGTDNRVIQGLRLQRLPEFGLLQLWKKTHVSSFLDLMLDKSLLVLTELRVGKVTVSLGPFGTDCMHGIAQIPHELLVMVVGAGRRPEAGENRREAGGGRLENKNGEDGVERLEAGVEQPSVRDQGAGGRNQASDVRNQASDVRSEASNAKGQTSNFELQTSNLPSPPASGREQGTGVRHQTSDVRSEASNTKGQTSNFELQTSNLPSLPDFGREQGTGVRHQASDVRSEASNTRSQTSNFELQTSNLPSLPASGREPEQTDALRVRDPMVPTVEDWRWTLRLVQHGYRLGEIALIRGKHPDGILEDLCKALDGGERVPIEQLFDRRTQIAIREFSERDLPQESPAVFSSFPRLWDFVRKRKT